MSYSFENNVGVITGALSDNAGVAVTFSNARAEGTAAPVVKTMAKDLDIFPWGHNNTFPNDIEQCLQYCSLAKAALKFKADSYYGGGLVYGKITGYNANGEELFEVAKPGEHPDVDQFFCNNDIPQFMSGYLLDLAYYANAFPELILNKGRDKIETLAHQEACDARFGNMDLNGTISKVYLSKLWGKTAEQIVHFGGDKCIRKTLKGTDGKLTKVDNRYLYARKALSTRFPFKDLKKFAADSKKPAFIYPIQFKSPNKAYYQLAHWDGALKSGWIDIACKIPQLINNLYDNGFTLRYHIEIPYEYFTKRHKDWDLLDEDKQKEIKEDLLAQMNSFLKGSENAYKSLITFYSIDPVSRLSHDQVKITPIDSKSSINENLLTSGTANREILAAMNINSSMFGLGDAGDAYGSNQGGSSIREGKAAHDSTLTMDRHIALAPIRLIARFNGWDPELQFRWKDTVLTTRDTGIDKKIETV